ncbi:MAG: hypothetical protein KJ958_03515 [Gammaproteobacteria bacterium]|nr:hypothetical protein [Gammaproteobacteria bacterium]MBU1978218.1 hypothetical protein [Gammaproteobacteria bacterium]
MTLTTPVARSDPGQSEDAKVTTCGGPKEAATRLQQRIEQAGETLQGLSVFVSGNALDVPPPASLFIVDLADEDAIKRRVAELAEAAKAKQPVPPQPGSVADCASRYPELAAQSAELDSLKTGINRLRLEFLSLPRVRRDALVSSQQSVLAHGQKVVELEHERASAERQQSEASGLIETAEAQARSEITVDLRELASQRALLEKSREEIAGLQVRFSTHLRERTEGYRNTASQLSGLASVLTQGYLPQKINAAYDQTVQIWRQLVDQGFERIVDPQRYEPLPTLPAVPVMLLSRLGADPQAGAYQDAYRKAQIEYASVAALRQERFAEERNSLFRLLLQASKLRSELLKETAAIDHTPAFQLAENYFSDLYREIRIVPYRLYAFLMTQFLDIREKAGTGMLGLLEISGQLAIFALLVAIPFAIFYSVRGIGGWLDGLRREMIREQMHLTEARRRMVRATAIVIRRINVYLPWVVMLLGIWLAERLIAATVFADIAAVLPYLAYYVWFRIFVNLVSGLMGIIAYTGTLKGVSAVGVRIQHTAKRVGAFFFIALAMQHATLDVVGEALVYRIVSALMLYLGAVICFVAARQWRDEIVSRADRVLPVWLAGRVQQVCSGWLSWFGCLPALILLIGGMSFARVRNWAGETDLFKHIGAEIFRRRIEGTVGGGTENAAQKKNGVLPAEYLNWFDLGAPEDASLLIEPSNGIVERIQAIVQAWTRESGGEHSLAIYGDKGSGKSSLLRVVENASQGCRVIKITVPAKLASRAGALEFFSKSLALDLAEGLASLAAMDKRSEKTLVLVDEAHNLFLAKPGGFEGYQAFMELVNANTTNLFWCVNFNRRSWDYLEGAFGRGQLFRNTLEIPPLTDADVQNLILRRHRHTGFLLSYDTIIRATQGPDDFTGLAQIETQFFRLLWGQSKGNPRAAIVLWTSALSPAGKDRLKVGIPYYRPIIGLAKLGDEALFVYAAIVRHENLTVAEAVATTSLPEAVVRDAIRAGINANAIACGEDKRYRFSPTAQFALIQFLLGKNFIHG